MQTRSARAGCREILPGGTCIPDSALSCVPFGEDGQACDFAHGLSRVRRAAEDGRAQAADGAGFDSTLYWPGGCEMPRLTMFEPGRRPAGPVPPTWTSYHIQARADGSEAISLEGWGTIELWPAEPEVREHWARNAGQGQSWAVLFWVAQTKAGAYEVWILGEDQLAACEPYLRPVTMVAER